MKAPESHYVTQVLEAAQQWGRSPSAYLCRVQDLTGDVRLRDRMLEVAYTSYKNQLCPHCGYPREICKSQERFEAQRQYCFAKAAVEQAEKDEGSKRDPGVLYVPVYQPPPEVK